MDEMRMFDVWLLLITYSVHNLAINDIKYLHLNIIIWFIRSALIDNF